MAFKLKTSKETEEIFDRIESSENLPWPTLMKLALSLSIRHGQLMELELYTDSLGKELNRPTITGDYDTIYVKESYAFAYTAAPNIASVNSTSQDYMTSLSNGAVVGQATPKYNSLGSVIWNQTVGYSNSSYERSSTDPYTLTAAQRTSWSLPVALAVRV